MRASDELTTLFIDFNGYFAACEQQENPGLRGRPVAVAPVAAESTSVIAASREAKAHGVRTGTKVHEARRACPGLAVVAARPALYVAYHHRLMREIERHLPVCRVCSIDEAYGRLIGSEREPARAIALARRVKAGIAAHVGAHLPSSIGLAPTPLLAKIATDLEKPDGLVVLRPADLPGRLANLRLSDLCGIGRGLEARLRRAGVADVPALWALAPKQARALWGSVAGERFWYALHGYDVPEPETARRSIGHGRVLAPDLRAAGPARLVARALLLKAARRMRRHGLAAGGLLLAVRARAARLDDAAVFPPTGDSFLLLDQLDALWARLFAGEGRAPARMSPVQVSVVLHRLVEVVARPPDLFAPRDGEPALGRGERLWAALDRLDARFGAGTVSLASQRPLMLPSLGTKIAFTRIPERADFRD